MDKTSQEYSKSVEGTHGTFYPHFGKLKMLMYLDIIIFGEGKEIYGIKEVGHIRKILGRVNRDFAELHNIKDLSTQKHAAELFKRHYVDVIEKEINFEDRRIKSIMQNFVVTKAKLFKGYGYDEYEEKQNKS